MTASSGCQNEQTNSRNLMLKWGTFLAAFKSPARNEFHGRTKPRNTWRGPTGTRGFEKEPNHTNCPPHHGPAVRQANEGQHIAVDRNVDRVVQAAIVVQFRETTERLSGDLGEASSGQYSLISLQCQRADGVVWPGIESISRLAPRPENHRESEQDGAEAAWRFHIVLSLN